MTLLRATAYHERFRFSNRLSVVFYKRFLLLSKSVWRVPLPIHLLFANIAHCCCTFGRIKQAKDNEILPIRLKFSKWNMALVRVRRVVYDTRFEGIPRRRSKTVSLLSPAVYVPDRSSRTYTINIYFYCRNAQNRVCHIIVIIRERIFIELSSSLNPEKSNEDVYVS